MLSSPNFCITQPLSISLHSLPQEQEDIDGEDEAEDSFTDKEEDLGAVEEERSVILHLLSQLKLGMDLTRVGQVPSGKTIALSHVLLVTSAHFLGACLRVVKEAHTNQSMFQLGVKKETNDRWWWIALIFLCIYISNISQPNVC